MQGNAAYRSIFETQPNVEEVLKQATQAYENYLLRSNHTDLETAIDYYIEAIDLDPTVAESYYKLASLLWEKGQIDLDMAVSQCEKAVELDPVSPSARLYLGYFYKIADRYDDAQQEFLTSIRLRSLFSARPRLALALTLIQKMREQGPTFKDFSQAMYCLFSGTIMVSWDYATLRMLYKTFMENVSVFIYKVTGSILKKLKGYNLAVKMYEDAISRTGRSEMFYSRIADISLKRGDPHIAVECYKKALESNPDNSVLWIKLATTLQTYYEDDVDEIKDCYQCIAQLEPSNARVYYELGHLYLKLEDKLNAVNSFKKAVELEEDNPFYHNSLAYSLIHLDDYDGAIDEYNKAIKINPDNQWTSVVCLALGSIYHQVKNNLDAAIVTYRTASVLDPQNVDAFTALGEIYHAKADLDNAINNYCEAIKIDPNIPKVYCSLGLVLWERDYVEEAIVAFQKATILDMNYDIAFNNLGVVYLDGAGQAELAVDVFAEAIRCNPSYALAYYNKGRAHQSLFQQTDAAECYQMALDLNKITEELNELEVQERLYSLFDVETC